VLIRFSNELLYNQKVTIAIEACEMRVSLNFSLECLSRDAKVGA
jgi:hypothetical protein